MNAWQGESIEDKSILVWTDQGLGDSVMIARYLPMIRAKRIVVYADAAVFRLLRKSFPQMEVLMKGWAFPRTDLHVPFMSLPFLFGLKDEKQIPQGRYLHPPKKFYPAEQNSDNRRLRVGVNWQGNKRFVRDFTRSMPFSLFEPLLSEDCTFFSLQKGNAHKDLANHGEVIDLMDDCVDLCDTASLVDELDLIISTDTVVPHIGGALGKPVWLLEAYESEWRWGMGDVSPWYKSVRVLRQSKPGDWQGVVQRARDALRSKA